MAMFMHAEGGNDKTKVYTNNLQHDASKAGGAKSKDCILILTEGVSGKRLVEMALDVMPEESRNLYGVFALQGKILNVKKANQKEIGKNKVIKRLKEIIGLEDNLRYGKLMIMTDQDLDGFHIKGLIINLFHSLRSDLVERKDAPFISEFVTPMYKATHVDGEVLSFYSKIEYDLWDKDKDIVGWTIKHYKGLATNTEDEAQEYFRNFKDHQRVLVWDDDAENAIETAFGKDAKTRKTWIDNFVRSSFLDRKNKQETTYSDFINKELILFSIEHARRTIPMLVDGLKPSQRKSLFSLLGRDPKQYNLLEFAAYVSENSDYHHGELSIINTIVKMAQDYVGRNNISLLEGIGQFGTRKLAGKDRATARYIYTQVSPLTRLIFHVDDDSLLKHMKGDNGEKIEPEWYMPIIPMILVNGCRGVGSGFSTFIPNFDTKVIIKNIRRQLDGLSLDLMEPSYNGFKGKIKKVEGKHLCYSTTGVHDVNELASTIRITELPINHKAYYMRFLESMKRDKKRFIEEINDRSTSSHFDYTLTMSKENMDFAVEQGINRTFRLETKIKFSNMKLFVSQKDDDDDEMTDDKMKMKTYKTPKEIFEEFYNLRSRCYVIRKKSIEGMMGVKLMKLKEIQKYFNLVMQNKVEFGKPRASLEKVLSEEHIEKHEDATGKLGYGYLLDDLSAFTEEKGNELTAEISKLSAELNAYTSKNANDLWREDLERLEDALEKLEFEKLNPKKRKAESLERTQRR